jgi:hypothetical protein
LLKVPAPQRWDLQDWSDHPLQVKVLQMPWLDEVS